MRLSTLLALLVPALVNLATGASLPGPVYKLSKKYDASNFLSSFDFQNSPDIWTDGFANYISQADPQHAQLAQVVDGKIYLGVDSTTVLDANHSPGRKSIRAESKDEFSSGLLVADFAHIPGNVCGIWPAFWLLYDSATYSEFDIIESVSLSPANEVSLYTSKNPCTLTAHPSTGHVRHTQCSTTAALSGCGVNAPAGTFGDAVNHKGGGVWATLIEDDGIKVWYFERGHVPLDLQREVPEPRGWGTPILDFGKGSCDVKAAWQKMKIILNITFCGAYAGDGWSTFSKCQAKTGYQTCNEYVAKEPKAYREAYFLVNSIKTFDRR
ncbi:glycoside hydrolase family 16 protein [Massariosphaeria phaeospora]|uniref:Glycoside hydrolase family 16 protein n=1 Tax=Massariosphaeria phaeospora TaxID=100035 RepID=A0A7C8M565_9PLEO|nr:glycoside hydrolase family 16 protein [Massariosphaeria phaeospora]